MANFLKMSRRHVPKCFCHRCMINVSGPSHSSAAAARYKFIPFKFSAARAVSGRLRGSGGRGAVGGTRCHHSSDENWRKMGGHRLPATSSITASRRSPVDARRQAPECIISSKFGHANIRAELKALAHSWLNQSLKYYWIYKGWYFHGAFAYAAVWKQLTPYKLYAIIKHTVKPTYS